jgi:hypothetical protein
MTALFTDMQMAELKGDRYKIQAKKMAEKLAPFAEAAVEFYAKEVRPESQRILDDLKHADWAFAFEFKSYDFRDLPGNGNEVVQWKRNCKGDEENAGVLDVVYAEFSHSDRVCMRDPRGTMFAVDGVRDSMWRIWRWTDFRTRLLTEFGLDPKHFEFKTIATAVHGNQRLFKNDSIREFMNHVYLVYKQFPKKN